MKKMIGPDYQALAEEQLRDTSLRATEARTKVLAALLSARYALSHQDVQETLSDMDRVTLYRTLDCLTDAGLAHKITGDDRVFRYNAGVQENDDGDRNLSQEHQHGHFKCTRCAKVFCIDDVDEKLFEADRRDTSKTAATLKEQLQIVLQSTLGRDFQTHEIELTIKGWCAECAH